MKVVSERDPFKVYVSLPSRLPWREVRAWCDEQGINFPEQTLVDVESNSAYGFLPGDVGAKLRHVPLCLGFDDAKSAMMFTLRWC